MPPQTRKRPPGRVDGIPTTPGGGLTADELELLERLEQRRDAEAAGAPREFSTRELVVASLLRLRDHLDGCPATVAEEVAAARTEAYQVTKPPDPSRSLPETQFVVVRCMECAGMRQYKDHRTPDDLIASTLRARHEAEPAGEDRTL